MLLWFVALFSLVHITHSSDEECWMTPKQIAGKYGYQLDRHWVTTEDGYILELHRIAAGGASKGVPGGCQGGASKGVVFLQHGLLDSSVTWLLNCKHGSFGFILSDAGYDVWMGNVRGNTYSKNHTTIPPNSPKFWDFSLDEMASRDLPAMIEYVLMEAGERDLVYIGHSQGTEIGFIEFSRNEDLAKRIKLMVALAPIAKVGHIHGLMKYLSPLALNKHLTWAAATLGIHQLFPSSWLTKLLVTAVCPHFEVSLCTNLMFTITGSDLRNFNSSRVEVYECHNPAGTSLKNTIHWAQLINTNTLKMFDYGSEKDNTRHYGQPEAPGYDISGLTVRTVLVSGGEDTLADPQDELWLISQIGAAIVKVISIDYYNHLDFLWGLDAPEKLYYPIIKMLDSGV